MGTLNKEVFVNFDVTLKDGRKINSKTVSLFDKVDKVIFLTLTPERNNCIKAINDHKYFSQKGEIYLVDDEARSLVVYNADFEDSNIIVESFSLSFVLRDWCAHARIVERSTSDTEQEKQDYLTKLKLNFERVINELPDNVFVYPKKTKFGVGFDVCVLDSLIGDYKTFKENKVITTNTSFTLPAESSVSVIQVDKASKKVLVDISGTKDWFSVYVFKQMIKPVFDYSLD